MVKYSEEQKANSYLPLTAQINVLADNINKTNQRLNKQLYVSKKKLVSQIRAESSYLQQCAKQLDKYHNVLTPYEARNPDNSIFEELVKIKLDIESVQMFMAHNQYKDADELLQDIKERI